MRASLPAPHTGPFDAPGLEDLRRAGDTLVRRARQEIALLSLDLDAALYDRVEFIQALKTFALASPRRRIRILVKDPKPALLSGHRLPYLAERLSSRIFIRRLPELDAEIQACLLLADRHGYLRRPSCRLRDGVADFHAPLEVARHWDEFEERWQRSVEDPALRRLHL